MTDTAAKRPCVSCKFYKEGGLFGLIEPRCLNPECDDKAFTYTDPVSGKTREWDRQHATCYKARLGACYNGKLWVQK